MSVTNTVSHVSIGIRKLHENIRIEIVTIRLPIQNLENATFLSCLMFCIRLFRCIAWIAYLSDTRVCIQRRAWKKGSNFSCLNFVIVIKMVQVALWFCFEVRTAAIFNAIKSIFISSILMFFLTWYIWDAFYYSSSGSYVYRGYNGNDKSNSNENGMILQSPYQIYCNYLDV